MKKGLKSLLFIFMLGLLVFIPNTVSATSYKLDDNISVNLTDSCLTITKDNLYTSEEIDETYQTEQTYSYGENDYDITTLTTGYEARNKVISYTLIFLLCVLIYYAFKEEEKGYYR